MRETDVSITFWPQIAKILLKIRSANFASHEFSVLSVLFDVFHELKKTCHSTPVPCNALRDSKTHGCRVFGASTPSLHPYILLVISALRLLGVG